MTPDELRIRCADKTPNPKTLREEVELLIEEILEAAEDYERMGMEGDEERCRKYAQALKEILDRTK